MTGSEIHQRVAEQFGPTAAKYAQSESHGKQSVLAELVELVDPQASDSVLDIATGPGHTALAFAPRVHNVVALDITPSMLAQVEATAKERGLTNVTTLLAPAEKMPLPDESFDVVTVRVAPHHFADVGAFLAESHRVLKPGGKFLLVDSVVQEDDFLDSEINRLEMLRDPSHVRDYRPSEWHSMLEKAGFQVESSVVGSHAGGTRMELMGWIERINTPIENRDELVGAFLNAPPELVEGMKIQREGDTVTFELPELTLLATKS